MAAGSDALIRDSFERDTDSINQITGWTTFVYKPSGSSPLGTTKAGVFIADEQTQGPASDGTRALYLFNKGPRRTDRFRDVYFVSPPRSIAEFESISLRFKYLVFGLNGVNSCSEDGTEYVRIETCNASVADCGLNEGSSPDSAKFLGSIWKTVFQHDAGLDGNSLGGHHHAQADWVPAGLELSLAEADKSKPLMFRFHAHVLDRAPYRAGHVWGLRFREMTASPDDDGPEDNDSSCHQETHGGLFHLNPSAAIDDVQCDGIRPDQGSTGSGSSSSSGSSSGSTSGSSGSDGGGEGPPVDPPIGL